MDGVEIAWLTMSQRFYIETLGCPKNDVDSDKLVGALLADGMEATDDAALADLVVVNTCAFIDEARRESIDTILALDELRMDGSASWSPDAWPSATATNSPPNCPRSTRSPASASRSRGRRRAPLGHRPQADPVSSTAIPTFDLLNLPSPKSASRGPT
jgi:ribosomal protein S12 methylthiotransferase